MTRKAEYQAFLKQHKVLYSEKDTVKVLQELTHQLIQELQLNIPIIYEICEIASKRHNRPFRILRLPPYHSPLNAIEMMWSQAKSHLREHSEPNAKIENLMDMFKVFCESFPAESARKLFQHVVEEEIKFKQLPEDDAFPIEIDRSVETEEIDAPDDYPTDQNEDIDEEPNEDWDFFEPFTRPFL